MNITILGSGTSTGVPMVGCTCRVCSSDDPRNKRTRPSLLMHHGSRNILVDTGTDLRRQALRQGIARIDAVLYTHPHADHINGIDDLRGFHFLHREIIPCFGSKTTLDLLLRGFGYIFEHREGSGYTPLMYANEVSSPFNLFGLTVVPVPLEHGMTTALGYRVGNFAYLTDCSHIPEKSLPLLEGLDLLVMDGLRWTPHPFHFNIEGAIEVAQRLGIRRTVLTHLSHDVAYSDRTRLPEGIEFAYDGMEFELPEG